GQRGMELRLARGAVYPRFLLALLFGGRLRTAHLFAVVPRRGGALLVRRAGGCAILLAGLRHHRDHRANWSALALAQTDFLEHAVLEGLHHHVSLVGLDL